LDYLEPHDYFGDTDCVLHPGEDWNINTGGDSDCDVERVYAIGDGIVVEDPKDCHWGALVVEHDGVFPFGQLWSVYGHMDKTEVPVGESVQRGDCLGVVSKKGLLGGPCHVHFEIRQVEPATSCFFPREKEGGNDPLWVQSRYLDPSDFLNANRPPVTACQDGDNDGYGSPANSLCAHPARDCDDTNFFTHPDAAETNDGEDNQCSCDAGFGVSDEVGASAAFDGPVEFSWSPQPGAIEYEVAASPSPEFDTGCTGGTTQDTVWLDPGEPPIGTVRYYIVRTVDPFVGSWGQNPLGDERLGICP
jgi:hypothetical protein